MTAPERTDYAPILPPKSGLRWARRKARDHAPAGRPAQLHIANAGGRTLCDGGPSVSRGIGEPLLASEIHPECLNVFKFRHDPERLR